MKTDVEELSPTRVRLTIEVPFEELKPPPNVAVEILPYGGHIGFVGWDGSGGVRWAESRVTDWVTKEGIA